MCEKCGCPSGLSGALRIVGHGILSRELRRLGDEQKVEEITLTLRRYHCLECGHVMIVGPREVRSRFRYGACLIVLALALWGDGASESELRRRFSGWNMPSCTKGKWAVLYRWMDKASLLFGSRIPWFEKCSARSKASQLARWIGEQCGHPDSELPPLERVVQAARTIVF